MQDLEVGQRRRTQALYGRAERPSLIRRGDARACHGPVLFTSVFLATTSSVWNVSAAENGHATSRPHDAANGMFDRSDEGVRFACSRHQLQAIKVGMAEYLKSLALPEALVVVTERPADGVLVYTLATPPRDTSTLDFSARSAMNISTEEVTLSVGSDSTSQVRTVSRQEILLALLQHGRLTTLRGSACSVEALSDHVALRQNIVAWAENLRWGWPNGEAAEWNEKYWNHGTPKPGVPLREAIDDAFANQSAYAMGCYTATKLAIVKGVLDYYDRVRASPALARLVQARLLSDHDPLSDLEPGSVWSFEPGFNPKDASRPGKLLALVREVSPKNFVPGDWVYFLNTDPVSRQKIGYEGSNAIYLGRDRFDDYYGENNHAYTYAEKLDEVFQWRNGVFSRIRDAPKRKPLDAQDLERLSASPKAGGLLEPWRVVPEFLEAPARHDLGSVSVHGARFTGRREP
jgi:Protein-glutamine gamma-glutamyltransferase